VIVLAPEQGALYEFLKPRQEKARRGRVVLERRVGERRRAAGSPVGRERRRRERRAATPVSAHALMSVLGFMVLHPEEGRPRRGGRAPRGARRR
jgi:hypothetical protein